MSIITPVFATTDDVASATADHVISYPGQPPTGVVNLTTVYTTSGSIEVPESAKYMSMRLVGGGGGGGDAVTSETELNAKGTKVADTVGGGFVTETRRSALNEDGTVLVVGMSKNSDPAGDKIGRGEVQVYKYDDMTDDWVAYGDPIYGDEAGDKLGFFVSINAAGTIIVMGAINNDVGGSNAGQVKVMKDTGVAPAIWENYGSPIYGDAAGDSLGYAVDINDTGDIVVIGAWLNDGGPGASCGQVKVMKIDDPSAPVSWQPYGGAIYGDAAGDRLGTSVAINGPGDIVIAGAIFNGAGDRGHAQTFKIDNPLNPVVWNAYGTPMVGDNNNDYFGSSVDINRDGNVVAVGAVYSDITGRNNCGQIKAFSIDDPQYPRAWEQYGNPVYGDVTNDYFGSSISMNGTGDIIVAGANSNDFGGAINGCGQVKILKPRFVNGKPTWVNYGSPVYGDGVNDLFGYSVGVSKDGKIFAGGSAKYTKSFEIPKDPMGGLAGIEVYESHQLASVKHTYSCVIGQGGSVADGGDTVLTIVDGGDGTITQITASGGQSKSAPHGAGETGIYGGGGGAGGGYSGGGGLSEPGGSIIGGAGGAGVIIVQYS